MFSKLIDRSVNRLTTLVLGLLVLLSACSQNDKHGPNVAKENKDTENDITSQLMAAADMDAIADHLLLARKDESTTRALAIHFPQLDREQAYQIQMALLAKMEAQGERLAGWKMGGTKITKPGEELDPIFGFMLASDQIQSGSTLKSNQFAAGSPFVEAEVCFWLKQDLPGPKISPEELAAAIGGVGGASELISARVRDAEGGSAAGVNLGIADGLSHGGFILPQQQFPLDQVDFAKETSLIKINDEVQAEGAASIMMNGVPLDAVLALANELPKYDRYLRAGDVVIIGSMLESPPAVAGDHAQIIFSSFGALDLTLE
jgi:2-keto-4-pentenoate hydratase